MKQTLLIVGFSLGWAVTHTMTGSVAIAVVPPAVLSQNSDIAWSSVMQDQVEGRVVHDRNYAPDGSYAFVSSWSMQGIRATYTEYQSEIVGYYTVWRSKWVRENGKRQEIRYPEQEPLYNRIRRDRPLKAIRFVLNSKVFIYEGGSVAPELATALANAPRSSMTIRLVWEDDGITDMEIGKNTVAAWRSVFRSPRSAQNSR